jgi:hypothetical protein
MDVSGKCFLYKPLDTLKDEINATIKECTTETEALLVRLCDISMVNVFERLFLYWKVRRRVCLLCVFLGV